MRKSDFGTNFHSVQCFSQCVLTKTIGKEKTPIPIGE